MTVDKADGRSRSVGRFLELSLVWSMERAAGTDTLRGRASDVGNTDTGGPMSNYDADLRTLAAELDRVEQVFRGLSESDWHRPTLLQPVNETQARWTLFELAGHFDISIGLTRMLIADLQQGQ